MPKIFFSDLDWVMRDEFKTTFVTFHPILENFTHYNTFSANLRVHRKKAFYLFDGKWIEVIYSE